LKGVIGMKGTRFVSFPLLSFTYSWCSGELLELPERLEAMELLVPLVPRELPERLVLRVPREQLASPVLRAPTELLDPTEPPDPTALLEARVSLDLTETSVLTETRDSLALLVLLVPTD
jgi:hypothetical protein